MTLEDAMNGEYANAKVCFRVMAFAQLAMLATAVAGMLTHSNNTACAAIATFIGPLAVLILREIGSHFYGKGERVRKVLMLQSGLDRKPSEADFLDIFMRASERSKYEPKPIGAYYSQEGGAPGAPRLLFRLQESAFWTAAQARIACAVHYVISGLGAVVTALLVFVALRTAAGPGAVDLSKVLFSLLSFFVTGTFVTSARSFRSLAVATAKVTAQASSLRRDAEVDPIELYKVLSAYDVALAKAMPIPGYVYRVWQKAIQGAWNAAQTAASS